MSTPYFDASFPRAVRVLITAVSLVFAILLPAGYFALGYGAIGSEVQTKTNIKAITVTQLVVDSQDMWRFEEHRMVEMLSRIPFELDGEHAVVLDLENEIIAESASTEPLFYISRTASIFDAGVPVGRVVIFHSIHDLLVQTALIAVLGSIMSVLLFRLLRNLPLRAQRIIDTMHEDKERAEITLHSIGDGVITTDAEGKVEYLNPVAESLTGWTLEKARNQPIDKVMKLIDESTLQPTENPLYKAIHENRICTYDGQAALIKQDESTIAIEQRAAPIHNRQSSVIGAVTILHDVTSARAMAQRITWAATHDALTNLINRREFESRVDAALNEAKKSGKHHVLCYMDLDQFKIVNDTCGHAAGDELLKQLASLLQSKIRESDTLARLGGDEFGLLLDGCPIDRAELIAKDLLAAVKDFRFNWDNKVFNVGVSIGLIAITQDCSSRAEILSGADAACFSAKEQGRNRVCVFHRADEDINERRLEMNWAGRLNHALEEERFVLYYQSYLPLGHGNNEATHIEILIRMIDEDGEIIKPGSFLPAAERYNIVQYIDRWVIKTVCQRYHHLLKEFGQPLTCAINLSGNTINTEGLLDFIKEQVDTNNIPHEGICFEITETAAINNLRKAAEFMRNCKALGFKFALDDFGTGTSSFGYLRNLPVDYLKIDGSFVEDIENDPLDKAMTETINRVGKLMGMKTVGEYAVTDEVIGGLRTMGVDFAQGFGVHKPEKLP